MATVEPYELAAGKRYRKQQYDLLFVDAAGRHLRTPTVHEHSRLDRALVAAVLPTMTIHDLRHTAASLAVAPGEREGGPEDARARLRLDDPGRLHRPLRR